MHVQGYDPMSLISCLTAPQESELESLVKEHRPTRSLPSPHVTFRPWYLSVELFWLEGHSTVSYKIKAATDVITRG